MLGFRKPCVNTKSSSARLCFVNTGVHVLAGKLAYINVALPALAAGRMDIRYADMGTSACTAGQNPSVSM